MILVCGTLANLAKLHVLAQQMWLDGLGRILIDLMYSCNQYNDVNAVNSLLLLISNLAAVSHTSRINVLSEHLLEDVCLIIHSYISKDAFSVVESGCVVIANVSADAECRVKLGSSGICDVLAGVLQRHISNQNVVEQCCIAIINLSTNDTNNSYSFGNARVCQLLVDILEVHLNNLCIVDEALGAIVSLTNGGKVCKNHAKFYDAGICGSKDVNKQCILAKIVAVHTRQSTVTFVLGQCFKALATLAVDESCRTLLGRSGACEALAQWLRQHYFFVSRGTSSGQTLSMDDDELSLNLSSTTTGRVMKDALVASTETKASYEVSIYLLEQCSIAITNLACNNRENKLLLLNLKIHILLSKIMRDEYHSNVQIAKADKMNKNILRQQDNDGIISQMRKAYLSVHNVMKIDPKAESFLK